MYRIDLFFEPGGRISHTVFSMEDVTHDKEWIKIKTFSEGMVYARLDHLRYYHIYDTQYVKIRFEP